MTIGINPGDGEEVPYMEHGTLILMPISQSFCLLRAFVHMVLWYNAIIAFRATEGLCERTENFNIFLFFRPSLNGVLFLMFCLLVEGVRI